MKHSRMLIDAYIEKIEVIDTASVIVAILKRYRDSSISAKDAFDFLMMERTEGKGTWIRVCEATNDMWTGFVIELSERS